MQDPKNRHLGTIAQIYRAISSQLRHISTMGKKLVKQQYLPHMCVQYGELRPTDGWDWLFGAPQRISTGFASCLRYCTDVAQRRSTKLCRMFGRLLGWLTIYTFLGAFRNGILPGAKFTLHLSLAFSYISSITARHPSSVGVSQTLRRWTEGATYMRQGGHHVGHWPTF